MIKDGTNGIHKAQLRESREFRNAIHYDNLLYRYSNTQQGQKFTEPPALK